MAACFKCGQDLPPREKIFRATTCEKCGVDVKVCRNCTFYLPGAHWDCRETIPEAVRDKERATFCEFFRPQSNINDRDSAATEVPFTREDTARDKLKSLFGDN